MAFGMVAILAPTALYSFAKLSSAYPVSTAAIDRDAAVLNAFGGVRYTILLGMQFRGSGAWGCTSFIYFVHGAVGNGVVNVRLQRRLPGNWSVLEISLGYYTPFYRPCEYMSTAE